MLPCIQSALSVKGRKSAAIAREIDRTPQTLCGWFYGRVKIPARVRTALEAAMGSPVDWQAYEEQFAAAMDRRAPTPETPAKPAETPVQPPRRLTATPPAEKPGSAPKAPSSARAGLSRFLAPPATKAPAPAGDDFWNFAQ